MSLVGFMAYGMQEMCFAKANASVEKKWVIRVSRRMAYCYTACMGESVTGTNHKVTECIIRVKFHEGLEKLRTEAKLQFIKEQEKLEQKELDETSTVSFTRNMILQE